jgi:predicted kinase
MSTCYQLVGIPASGKSTWIKNQEWSKDCVVVSTDEFVEAYAKEVGSTYSEVFSDYMPMAVKLMAEKVIRARTEGRDIIWDQTSTTLASRTRKFNMLPDYEHIAVVFKTPDAEELAKRLASRPGKEIPDHVVQDMITGFEMPDLSEGFTQVWFAQNVF